MNPKSRFEIKFLVPAAVKASVMHDVLAVTDLDGNAADSAGGYLVKSIYYDSPYFEAYQDKMAGVLHRRKLRIRAYGNEFDNKFLEIKERFNNRIMKSRMPLDSNDYLSALQCRLLSGHKRDDIIKKYTLCISMFNYRPILTIEYKRQPLVGRTDQGLRVTFDSEIAVTRSRSFEEKRSKYRVLPHGLTVLEIKFDTFMPHWVNLLVRKYSLQDIAYSKYCLGLDKLSQVGVY